MSPLLAQSGHLDPLNQCPLLGVKRTLRGGAAMSAFDPKRTLPCQVCCDAQHSPQRHPLWPHAINFAFQGRHLRVAHEQQYGCHVGERHVDLPGRTAVNLHFNLAVYRNQPFLTRPSDVLGSPGLIETVRLLVACRRSAGKPCRGDRFRREKVAPSTSLSHTNGRRSV